MPQLPIRRTERLRHGRLSTPAARYFVTFVTAERKPWLVGSAADAVLSAIKSWRDEGDGEALAATIMPNHVHVLFRLGVKLDVGRCVSRWKAVGRRDSGYAGEWQRGFWEHRLGDSESIEDYGFYTFLNPYRARLIGREVIWPWWWGPEGSGAGAGTRFVFLEGLDGEGRPPGELIDLPDARFEGLGTGE